MQLTDYAWATTAQTESLEFWFYALVVSMLLSLYDLAFGMKQPFATSSKAASQKRAAAIDTKQKPAGRNEKTTSNEGTSSLSAPFWTQYGNLLIDLAIDGCDLTIPGTAVGWLTIDKDMVGLAMATSTVLTGQRIWMKVAST